MQDNTYLPEDEDQYTAELVDTIWDSDDEKINESDEAEIDNIFDAPSVEYSSQVDNNHIAEWLEKLAADELPEQEFICLFNYVCAIAKQMDNSRGAEKSGFSYDELAGHFFVYLARNNTAFVINNKSGLRREFKRFCTEKNNPAGFELWGIVSRTLLELERAGLVERAKEYRNRNNSNDTLWYDKENGSDLVNEINETHIPYLKLKSRGARDRLLKPAEARKIVSGSLINVGGAVRMKDLLDAIIQAYSSLRMIIVENKNVGENDDDTEDNVISRLPVDESFAADIMVEEEADIRASAIINGACRIRSGKRKVIKGEVILCCYLLPKARGTVSGVNSGVRLEEFGPSSSVHDVEKRIRELWSSRIEFVADRRNRDRKAMYSDIAVLVFKKLEKFCSEKVRCHRFNSSEQ